MIKSIPKIITINVQKLFDYYPQKEGCRSDPYCFDTRNQYYYRQVVKQIGDFDECPLYYQMLYSETFKKENIDIEGSDDWLLDKLMILDFGTIFQDAINAVSQSHKRNNGLRDKVRNLFENGLDIRFFDKKVHMLPFEKSGNMSRHSRITFINEKYYHELNQRLNLGIDFSKIKVSLSKYYAYRGLYLSSSKRVRGIEITPETLVVIKDKRMVDTKKSIKSGDPKEKRQALGPAYEKKIPIVSAKNPIEVKETHRLKWEFTEEVDNDLEYVKTPFDGVGLVSPCYAGLINKSLDINNATSFQVRMPFVKGMLHEVDFKAFLEKFDSTGMEKESYLYEDAFNIVRDLKKAQILLTESMFKAMDWLDEYCDNSNKDADPMDFYCKQLNKYGHSLYISGTNLPYGHSEYTHLNYQVLNTLNLTDEEFGELIEKHGRFINAPIDYINGWDPSEAYDFGETGIDHYQPAWKQAVLSDPGFKNDVYIDGQLKNTQKSLITKIANGKLVVAGQTRYLCRDLMPMLASLLKNQKDISSFYNRILNMRFYMPMDEGLEKNLRYSQFYAFFRNPHLSRNEQCMLRPFVMPREDEAYKETRPAGTGSYDLSIEKYKKYIGYYHTFFGHLKGVVMVPRGSIVPLCLGGADFDGDLVNVVFDDIVVNAVKRACYEETESYVFPERKLPVIKIPGTESEKEPVPEKVPYEHIEATFSNSIGYLSNAAISIGQTEYGKAKDIKFDKNGPACWKCTILTGLDIDAAKNGCHPDLSLITQYGERIPKTPYLKFKNKFDKLRKNPKYVFDKLKIKNKKEDNLFEIRVSGIDENIEYSLTDADYGTGINRLPVVFKEIFEKYKGEKNKSSAKCHPFKASFAIDEKTLIVEYKNKCDTLLERYDWYISYGKVLEDEKNKNSDAQDKIDKQIFKIYGEEQAVKVFSDVLPELTGKLDRAIPVDADIKKIMEKINVLKWQFQPRNNRAKILEKIIGNDFDAECLSGEERELVYHFGQYGFKLLWHIVSVIGDSRIRPYDEVRKEYVDRLRDKKTDADKEETITVRDDELEKVTKAFYEGNLTNMQGRIYSICLEQLRNIMNKAKISSESKIISLYELTEGNTKKRRFFWDAFSWKEIEKCVFTDKKGF